MALACLVLVVGASSFPSSKTYLPVYVNRSVLKTGSPCGPPVVLPVVLPVVPPVVLPVAVAVARLGPVLGPSSLSSPKT